MTGPVLSLRRPLLAWSVLLGLVTAGCSLDKGSADPVLIGPSEFALSITMTASPDTLPRDGSSQAIVTTRVRNENGAPVGGQHLTLSISGPTGTLLSSTDATTDADGVATFAVTAPPREAIGSSAIIVSATPVTGNAAGAAPRTLTIRLSGTPNTTAPTAAFTVDPAAPEVNQLVTFDASTSTDEGLPCPTTCTFEWDFGDGNIAAGRIVTHRFEVARAHTVTLRVTDDAGTVTELRKVVSVASIPAPAITLSVTPAAPFVDQPAVFTASGAAAPGHSIQRYEWAFGDGSTATTAVPTVTHTYSTTGTFVATVTVVDDLGQAGNAALTVNVGHSVAALVARFTVSPTSPSAGALVTFNASGSTVGQGAEITKYVWNFGDGSADVDTGTTPSTTKTYAAAGSYVVTLRVTDSLGREAIATATVTVQ